VANVGRAAFTREERKLKPQKAIHVFCLIFLLATFVAAQAKRLWVIRAPGEMVEYDSVTFVAKATIKLPAEAVGSPQNLSVNHLGQILLAEPVTLPLAEGDPAAERKVWFWDGHTAITLLRDISRSTSTAGSNLVITESVASPFLSADGKYLYWSANRARRLQRDGIDLSTKTTWSFWKTDLAGAQRQDMAPVALPECSCPTGGCEETCPYEEAWIPKDGLGKFVLLTEFVSGKNQPLYKSTAVYEEQDGKWTPTPLDHPLHRVLDAASPGAILEAVPDTGCCGWSNQSDDQTLLHSQGKTVIVFDELGAYNNPDYDVSFYTENGTLSPDLRSVAFTIAATAQPNQPIQLAEEGQGNPEESQRIRKAVADLPAVEVKSIEDSSRRPAFLPHAALIGWLNDKEILISESHVLVVYNVTTGTRRKSNVHADATRVFLR
jgi:hypothetical protein